MTLWMQSCAGEDGLSSSAREKSRTPDDCSIRHDSVRLQYSAAEDFFCSGTVNLA
jgi:hypothetical protein